MCNSWPAKLTSLQTVAVPFSTGRLFVCLFFHLLIRCRTRCALFKFNMHIKFSASWEGKLGNNGLLRHSQETCIHTSKISTTNLYKPASWAGWTDQKKKQQHKLKHAVHMICKCNGNSHLRQLLPFTFAFFLPWDASSAWLQMSGCDYSMGPSTLQKHVNAV